MTANTVKSRATRARLSAYPDIGLELSRVAERFYSREVEALLGPAAPQTLAELLESRGVDTGIEVLVKSVIEALIALPETRRLDAGTALTEAEAAVLRQGGFELEVQGQGEGPLARGAVRFAALIGSSLTTPQAAQRLRVNASRVRQRLAERSLYGFKVGGDWRVPLFQFGDYGLVPGIDKVTGALPTDLHPVAVATWFISPSPDLTEETSGQPQSPIEWLGSGNDPEVVSALAAGL